MIKFVKTSDQVFSIMGGEGKARYLLLHKSMTSISNFHIFTLGTVAKFQCSAQLGWPMAAGWGHRAQDLAGKILDKVSLFHALVPICE